MARGRPRKNRLSRMDAAIDAMVPYGFREEKVEKVVKALLKEYGGHDGWPFIELDAYQELIDAILRDKEQNGDEEVHETALSKNNSLEDREVGTSNRGSDTQQCDQNTVEHKQTDAPTSSRMAAEHAFSEVVSSSSGVLNEVGVSTVSAEGAEKVYDSIVQSRTFAHTEKQTTTFMTKNDGEGETIDEANILGHNVTLGSPSTTNIRSPSPSNSLPTQRRRFPCFGWIESDEEDSYDFIRLTPARESEATPHSNLCTSPNNVRSSERKRRSRWDEKPDDPEVLNP